MNQLNPAATDNFKKTTNKVQFQSASHDYPTQAQTLAYNSASGNPSISMVIKPTQLQVGQDQLYQSYKNNTSVSQSYETPKFNYYPSPYSSIDMKNSVSNFNSQMQASVPNSLSAPTPPYFNILLPNPSPDSPPKVSAARPSSPNRSLVPSPQLALGICSPRYQPRRILRPSAIIRVCVKLNLTARAKEILLHSAACHFRSHRCKTINRNQKDSR